MSKNTKIGLILPLLSVLIWLRPVLGWRAGWIGNRLTSWVLR